MKVSTNRPLGFLVAALDRSQRICAQPGRLFDYKFTFKIYEKGSDLFKN